MTNKYNFPFLWSSCLKKEEVKVKITMSKKEKKRIIEGISQQKKYGFPKESKKKKKRYKW